MRLLHDGFFNAARRDGHSLAVIEESGESVTYAALHGMVERVARQLVAAGVSPGDRVAVVLPKSANALATIIAILRSGAAYVPVDPDGPHGRTLAVLQNCRPRLVLTDQRGVERLGMLPGEPPLCVVAPVDSQDAPSIDHNEIAAATESLPAYILHTSGSTGTAKGVVVSHRAATTFVRWASGAFGLSKDDRIASIAPLHFDLSVFDVFASQRVGAVVVLLSAAVVRNPLLLAERLSESRITTLYATPSVLMALQRFGRLERYQFDHIRQVLFAGEVFPVPQLRELMKRWPQAAFHNLFGPTETNVCTWYRVPAAVISNPPRILPIGRACPHYRIRIDTAPGSAQRGELLVSGDGLMTGYLNRPEDTASAFVTDAEGVAWYRTGDLVSQRPDGLLLFHGRRDRMVKRHGFRIELGEIEACLRRHPALAEVAVVAVTRRLITTAIHAFIVPRSAIDLIQLRSYCADELPAYMIPNRFSVLEELPLTASGKIDLNSLEQLDIQ